MKNNYFHSTLIINSPGVVGLFHKHRQQIVSSHFGRKLKQVAQD